MSIIGSNVLAGASGQTGGAAAYEIERSVRFSSSDSAYLSRTFALTNRRTWTFSTWVKRSKLGTAQNIFQSSNESTADQYLVLNFDSSDRLFMGGGPTTYRLSTARFRDVSAWYHIVLTWDTTQATAADRVRLYVNGTQLTTFDSSTDPSQNFDGGINRAKRHSLGVEDYSSGVNFLDAYLADIHFIDGQALTPSSFGEFDTNGVWQPIDASGLTYGTNGFHLPFSDNSTAAALGTDASSNGNTWTVTNLSVTAGAGNDSLVDSPTSYGTPDTGVGGEVRGNYATFNALLLGSTTTLSDGNLQHAAGATRNLSRSTQAMSTGKWYFEITVTNYGTGGDPTVGIIATTNYSISAGYAGSSSDSYGYAGNGFKYNVSGSAYGNSFGVNDVIGAAFNADTGKLFFSKNGVWQNSGDPVAGTGEAFTVTGAYYFAADCSSSTAVVVANFGQRPFAYTAPSGFKALCTTNLPDPTIADGSTAFEVITYQGNGTTQTLPNTDPTTSPQEPLKFSPDFVWIKQRSGATSHTLHDTIRGTQLEIYSDSSSQEYPSANGLTAFNSDGFTLGNQNYYNGSGLTFVAWAWDAGGTTDPSNEAGSITSQVRANASAGFSVVTYTGNGTTATVGHGLGVAPYLMIHKARNLADFWLVYHGSLGASTQLNLSATSAAGTGSTKWNSTAPTSTVFTVTNDGAIGQNAINYVTYCFAPVAGYSSFGSYTGNGSADGPFVYTGFRPRWILIKNSSATADWSLFDTARDSYNQALTLLAPNLAAADNVLGSGLDILSNGFKLRRDASPAINASSNTFVYACFAESPFQYARAR